MTRALFEKIKNSPYADFVSFAVWNKDDINDLSVIEKSIDILNQNIIIVSLNASRGLKKFQNFHFRHRGGRDSWLEEAFNNSYFRGAYMTDVIKNDTSSKQSLVDLSKKNIAENIKEFRKELFFIECKNPHFIVIGSERKTTGKLKQYLPKYTNNIHFIPHYHKKGITKHEFLESVRKLEKKL